MDERSGAAEEARGGPILTRIRLVGVLGGRLDPGAGLVGDPADPAAGEREVVGWLIASDRGDNRFNG